MDVSEAARWFSNTALDGWDGTNWVSEVAMGDFHSYDRFITERTFGAKKRVFLAPSESALDHSLYPVVRTADGKVWVVISDNADIEGVEAYQNSYLLVHAAYSADIVEFTTTTMASGQEKSATPSIVATSVCDIERFSVDRSDDFETVVYGLYKIVLPASIVVDTDNEIVVNGAYYEVQDTAPELLATAVRALKRAA